MRASPSSSSADDTILAAYEELAATFDPAARETIAQEAFIYLFEQYSDIPLASIHAEVVVEPSVVGGWDFPGVTSAGISHWQLIRPAECGAVAARVSHHVAGSICDSSMT